MNLSSFAATKQRIAEAVERRHFRQVELAFLTGTDDQFAEAARRWLVTSNVVFRMKMGRP